MKTCHVCRQQYHHVSPITIQVYDGESNTRISNICNIRCQTAFMACHQVQNDNKAYVSYIPMTHLDQCQYCGSHSHQSEFCWLYDTEQETIDAFNSIDNKAGEWTTVEGYICVIVASRQYSIEYTQLDITANMYQLNNDIEARNPLLYFWQFTSTTDDLVKEISTDKPPVSITKSFITRVNPILTDTDAPTTKVSQVISVTKRIHNPHKAFFPFDLRQENCWWPTEQTTSSCVKLFTTSWSKAFTIEEHSPQQTENMEQVYFKYEKETEQQETPDVDNVLPPKMEQLSIEEEKQ